MWVLGLIGGLLLLVAIVFLVRPLFKTYSENDLLKNQIQANRRKELNIKLYEQKKRQLEQDFANGFLDEEARQQAQNEIEHSLIQDAQFSTDTQLEQLSPLNARKLAIAFLIFIPFFSIVTYAFIKPKNFDQVVLGEASPTPSETEQQAPDINAMVVSLENKLKSNPDNIQGWNMLGRSYVVMKRFDDAVGAYEKALDLGNKAMDETSREIMPELEINYVEALMQTGKTNNLLKAQQELDRLLKINPNNGDALWFLGFLDYQTGNKPLAVEHWTQLLGLLEVGSEQAKIVNSYLNQVKAELNGDVPQENPTQGPAPDQQLTGSAEEQAFISSMVARVEKRVQENPQDLKSWKALGKSYSVLERNVDSAEAYAKAVALAKDDVELLINYTNSVIKTGQNDQLDKARIVFAQLLDKNSNNVDALFLSGMLSRAAGDVEEARMFWTQLLPLLAEDSPAYTSVEKNLKSL